MAKRRRSRVSNPRIACGVVSGKRNKYVGGTVHFRGLDRRVIGCAEYDGDRSFYATRVVGKAGTRYVRVKKRALRDLKSRSPRAVHLLSSRRKAVHTSAALISAFEKRYAKPAKKARKASPARKRKLSPAARKAFLAKMNKGRRAAGLAPIRAKRR